MERAGELGHAEEDGGMGCIEASGEYELTDVDENHRPKIILVDIVHIKFSHLKRLFLCRNFISSIEALQRVEMPALQVLFLSINLAYLRQQ